MKKSIILITIIIAAFFSVIIINILLFDSKQVVAPEANDQAGQMHEYTAELSQAIRFKTISSDSGKLEFEKFNKFLEKDFPLVHRTLDRTTIGHNSLLYTWKGSQESLAPVLFVSHSDVVPVDSQNLQQWTHPPFSGHMDDTHIWGRGSLDNKANIIAQLGAVENLLAQGRQPQRSLMFFIGEDEETGGKQFINTGLSGTSDASTDSGAAKAWKYLESKNIQPAYLLDEGGLISQGIVPFIARDVALVGIAEKGYLTLELEARQTGGHASMPPANTAIGSLSTALHRLEQNKIPRKMTRPVTAMFDYLGPEMSFLPKALFANQWLFQRPLLNRLSKAASTNATIQSTMAITRIHGGIAENVLPRSARATVNVRLLPGDSIRQVVDHVRNTINNPDIKLFIAPGSHEASAVSSTDSEFFLSLQKTIRTVFPGTLVAPFLTVTATDSRHFNNNADVYRFSPYPASKDDLERIHGIDERISREAFNKMLKFYEALFLIIR